MSTTIWQHKVLQLSVVQQSIFCHFYKADEDLRWTIKISCSSNAPGHKVCHTPWLEEGYVNCDKSKNNTLVQICQDVTKNGFIKDVWYAWDQCLSTHMNQWYGHHHCYLRWCLVDMLRTPGSLLPISKTSNAMQQTSVGGLADGWAPMPVFLC